VLRRALLAAPPPDDFFFQLAGGSAIRDRIAKHLDAALFESVIASEVRAFASCDSTTRLFAVTEARLALCCPDAEAFVLEDEDPVGGAGPSEPIVQVVTFGSRELGTIALAPDPGRVAEAFDLVRVVSRELGGALRMTALVEETRKLAATDGLTRLMNRRAFVEWGERELARIDRYEGSLGLAILDVDHFKSINDRFGHGNGDRVLVEVARRVTAVLRAADVAARCPRGRPRAKCERRPGGHAHDRGRAGHGQPRSRPRHQGLDRQAVQAGAAGRRGAEADRGRGLNEPAQLHMSLTPQRAT